MLLSSCSYAIFEVTMPNGHLMEIQKAIEEGRHTILIYQVRDFERAPPPTLTSMLLSTGLDHYGYINFNELRRRLQIFFTS